MKHPPLPRRSRALSDDPTWYKDAIFYELRVRSFMDGNGDGIGDFVGLASKLDYLEDLGVTTLWLLPFYPSPGRDDGYDIADYTSIHPDMGTLDDFKRFLDEAHRRGLRVVTELVLNHTSDQHPWFQRARRAPPGSSERDFYVWSDTPDRYRGVRIIFQDFEPSNWTWDPLAKAYFWHRFYGHQPDLNFDHPEVHRALFEVVDFWLALGVDGLRLDAVPYLYEREGTSCENLPETHAFLKALRAHVDANFPNRMLLAEANQWPEDAAAYFGEGDECHMNFHFPIMPRLFMAIHMEDRFPIIDILEQTPELEGTSQWALFLRNHDELTLEMVTEEERDYMWRAFAREASMRINLGIRRRLAPLVGNDRRNIELMNALLFSMPGTPVLYYGDELGMGDNVYLGDRNGVRTPMQWSSDRNAGFSRANPQKLVLPVIVDPEYHFESVNVEAQQGNTSSLLWWTKRLIALRKRFVAFGRGSIHFLSPDNPRVLAFVREYAEERVLVVANLSRHVQYVELDLSHYEGETPVELFGQSVFPRIGELPYLLTLGGHGFYWFSLVRPSTAAEEERAAAYLPKQIEVQDGWPGLLAAEHRGLLEKVLETYITSRRWYGGRGKERARVQVMEALPISQSRQAHLLFVRFEYVRREAETYVLPVAFAVGEEANALHHRAAHAMIADLTYVGADGGLAYGALYDVYAEPGAAEVLLEQVDQERVVRGMEGELVGIRMEDLCGDPEASCTESRQLRGDWPSPAMVFDERLILRMGRRLHEGLSPGVEIGAHLLNTQAQAPVAALAGTLEYRPRGGIPVTVAVIHRYVVHEVDAYTYTKDEVGRVLERILGRERSGALGPGEIAPEGAWCQTVREGLHPELLELIGAYLQTAQRLGRRTGQLHLALQSTEDPAFTPEPFSGLHQRSLYQSLRNRAGTVLRALAKQGEGFVEPARTLAAGLVSSREALYSRFAPLLSVSLTVARCRFHGDLHLGKWLFTGRDFVAVDFEGDPSRPLSERRRKRSPLRDVASMLRSFHHAAYRAVLEPGRVREADQATAEAWARAWWRGVGAAFLRSYLDVVDGSPWVPSDDAELELLLDVYELERLLRDVERAMDLGGDRLVVPLLGLVRWVDGD